MNKYANDITANHLTHPGDVLNDEIRARNISQTKLAQSTGLSKAMICQVINCDRNVSPSIAVKLENALGIDASFWINLQNRYDRIVALQEALLLKKMVA